MLAARKVRDLLLEPGEHPHVAAASGIVRLGESLYILADDEHFLGVFPVHGNAPGRRLLLLHSSLPQDHAARKAAKPDFEVLTLLPAVAEFPHGALLALGSGSTAARCRAVLLPIASRGVTGAPQHFDLTQLYAALARDVPGLNLEGAAASGNTLRLLQRGNAPGGVNAVIDLDLAGLCGALARGAAPQPALVRGIRRITLGDLRGVPLGFTDASPLPDGRIVFSAVAEASPDTYADGPCLGSVIGLLNQQGQVTRVEQLDPAAKVEGVHATLRGDAIELLLVADADDPSLPAPLYSAPL